MQELNALIGELDKLSFVRGEIQSTVSREAMEVACSCENYTAVSPLESYTLRPSKTNLVISQEGVVDAIVKTTKAIVGTIWKIIDVTIINLFRVVGSVFGLSDGAQGWGKDAKKKETMESKSPSSKWDSVKVDPKATVAGEELTVVVNTIVNPNSLDIYRETSEEASKRVVALAELGVNALAMLKEIASEVGVEKVKTKLTEAQGSVLKVLGTATTEEFVKETKESNEKLKTSATVKSKLPDTLKPSELGKKMRPVEVAFLAIAKQVDSDGKAVGRAMEELDNSYQKAEAIVTSLAKPMEDSPGLAKLVQQVKSHLLTVCNLTLTVSSVKHQSDTVLTTIARGITAERASKKWFLTTKAGKIKKSTGRKPTEAETNLKDNLKS